MGSIFGLIVFERRLTGVHHDGVELEGTPLFQHLERPVVRPQRRVRVPPFQLFFEELLVMTGKSPAEFVFIFHSTRYTVSSWLTSAKVRMCDVGEGSAPLIQSTKGLLRGLRSRTSPCPARDRCGATGNRNVLHRTPKRVFDLGIQVVPPGGIEPPHAV